MDTGFFRSRQFLVAAILASLIVVGGAVAVGTNGFGMRYFHSSGCPAPVVPGEALAVAPEETREPDRRVLRWSLDASAYESGALDLCARLGDIHVATATDDRITLELRVEGGTESLRDEELARALFATDGARVTVAAWELEREVAWRLGPSSLPRTSLVLHVPEGLPVHVRTDNSVGDTSIAGLRAASLRLDGSVGDVRVADVLMEGDVSADTSAGDVTLAFASVQSGSIRIDTSVGDVRLQLPQRADVGYDVTTDTSVGDVVVRIGDVETSSSGGGRGPGGETHARSAGFAEKPTQVVVSVDTSVGDIEVLAE